MRAVYLSLCILAVTALPPRQFKRITERKLEQLEKKLEPTPRDKVELITPTEKNVATNEKDIAAEAPSLRSYYQNQSHVVSTTSSYTEDKQVSIGSPQVLIGGPQVNPNGMPMYLVPAPPQAMAQAPAQAPAAGPAQGPPSRGSHGNKYDSDAQNVYTVNVYVNFPNEEYYEYEDYEDGWHKTKKGEKKAGDHCKEGQLRVKGVCVDRH